MAHPPAPPYNFSPQVRALLERAGWYPGRVADPPVRLPASPSYPPQVLALLQEFGGLRIEYVHGIKFEPVEVDNEMVAFYSEELGRTLYPLGVSYEYSDVCIDLNGFVYIIGNWVSLAGQTFEDGITQFLTQTSTALHLNKEDMTWGPDRQAILPPIA